MSYLLITENAVKMSWRYRQDLVLFCAYQNMFDGTIKPVDGAIKVAAVKGFDGTVMQLFSEFWRYRRISCCN